MVALRAGARLAALFAGARFLVALRAGALGRLLRRSPLLGSLPCRSPLLGGLTHCRALRRLLRRSPLLGGLACRSPLGCLLRRSPLLRSLPRRSPLHGLPCRSPLDGLLRRRALRCLLCGGPLFRGLLGRGPSFCGYCHRCTSLGAWSLNRGEACATSRADCPPLCALPHRFHLQLRRPPKLRQRHERRHITPDRLDSPSCALTLTSCHDGTERAKTKPTDFVLRATLRCVAAHAIPSLTLRVHTFFVLFTCPGQAFFIRGGHFALVHDHRLTPFCARK